MTQIGTSSRNPLRPALLLIVGLGGCGVGTIGTVPDADADLTADGPRLPLFAARDAIFDGWQHIRLRGATDWRMAAVDGAVAIRAEGRRSASGLFRYIELEDPACGRTGRLSLRWRVDAIQTGADLTVRDKEDVGAGLFLLFGDPGLLSAPRPVPTLRYVWVGDTLPIGTVVDSPYLPGVVRSIVLRNGANRLGRWQREHRDIAADYEAAFGAPPPEPLQAIALFTDNDQTGEPVVAWFDRADLICPAG